MEMEENEKAFVIASTKVRIDAEYEEAERLKRKAK